MVKKHGPTQYKSINIPEELMDSVDRVLEEKKELGYRSRSEFIIDAVRRRVEEFL